jgi:tetratricopeptide (TPR) repeat protein
MGRSSGKKKTTAPKNHSPSVHVEEHEGKNEDKGKPGNSILSPLAAVCIIVFIGIIAYSNTFHVPFQFDDRQNIVEYDLIRDLGNFWPPTGPRYVGYLSFAINYRLHGLDVAGYHIVNFAVHVLTALLVYYLVILTFRTPFLRESRFYDSNAVNLAALCASVLFIAHPVHTQAVTYIVQRFASLAALFYILSLVLFIQARLNMQDSGLRTRPVVLFMLSVLACICAMKTKQNAFTLPFVIIVFDLFFFEGISLRKRLIAVSPFILTLLIIPLSHMGSEQSSGDLVGELHDAMQQTEEIPRWSYLFTQFRVIVTYLRLLFIPINQNLDYDYPVLHSFSDPEVLLSFLFLAMLLSGAVSFWFRSRRTDSSLRVVSFGIFWFFITLSVESSIIPIRDVIFEHRIYLPSIGLFMALSILLITGIQMIGNRRPGMERIAPVVVAVIVIALTGATYARNSVWKNDITLWEDVARKSPLKGRAHNNLGKAYSDAGKKEKAFDAYMTAKKVDPDYADPYYNLGLMYKDRGLIDKAIDEFTRAVTIYPEFPEAHNNLGNVYSAKGLIDRAIEHYRMAVKLDRASAEYYYNLGIVYYAKGMIDEAGDQFRHAIRNRQDYSEAHNNLGVVLRKKGDWDKAIQRFRTAVQLDPDNASARKNLSDAKSMRAAGFQTLDELKVRAGSQPEDAETHYKLGTAYDKEGKLDRAVENLKIAIRLKPDFIGAYNNLGIVYTKKEMFREALEQFDQVIRLNPAYANAYNNRGIIFEKQRHFEKAIEEYKKALEVKPDFRTAQQNLNRLMRKKR